MIDIDLAGLQDLLRALQNADVAEFKGHGLQVSFFPKPLPTSLSGGSAVESPKMPESPPAVRDKPPGSVWDDPTLWPNQGGKRLRFDGKLE